MKFNSRNEFNVIMANNVVKFHFLRKDGLDISSVEKTNRYAFSSSNSSSEIEATKGLMITENSECSYQMGEVISEDDLSLASSTDLAMSPPPIYFSSKARE